MIRTRGRSLRLVRLPARRTGRGRGFAFARYKNFAAYLRGRGAKSRSSATPATCGVVRAVAAVDSGEAVNPDGIRNQIEGGIVQSLTWTLYEAVSFDEHASPASTGQLSDPALSQPAR